MNRRQRTILAGALFALFAMSSTWINPIAGARTASDLAAFQQPSPSPEATLAVVREVLATGLPPAAPGQTLDLVRYTIQPGTTLAVHIHPGMQIAWVHSGELTYHVLKGEVQIGRAVNASAGQPGLPEILAAGESTVLVPGDWVAEVPGAVHYGENLGSEPLVLWAATLLESGHPPAISVNAEGTPVV
jgi:quercetin dioxygenase-like cupin family protein